MGKWVIVVLILLFGGGGYYGHNRYGAWPRYWSSAHDYRRAVLLGQRFHGSNHIRQPRRACRTRCGGRDGD